MRSDVLAANIGLMDMFMLTVPFVLSLSCGARGKSSQEFTLERTTYMAKRNPQDTIKALRDELAEKDEVIEQLEDQRDRLSGRLSRIESIADVSDIVEDEDVGEGEDDDETDDDQDGDE